MSLMRLNRTQPSPQAARLPAVRTALAAAVFMAAGLTVYFWRDANQFARYHAFLLLAVGSGLFAANILANTYPPRTLLFYFCCVFCVFHFGIAPIFLFPEYMSKANTKFSFDWYWDFQRIQKAHVISLVFLLGLLIASFLPEPGFRAGRGLASQSNPGRTYFISNIALVASSVVWLLLVRFTGAINYADFMETIETVGTGGAFGYVHGAIDAAFILAIVSGRALLPLSLFLSWGLIAFTFGLRRELAFPLVVAIGVLVSQRRLLISIWVLVVGALLFFGASALVSTARVSSGAHTRFDSTAVANGLAELGGSLRPVYEVIDWVDHDGYQLGVTYYAPFERTLLRVIPGAHRIPSEEDFRLTHVLMASRLGPFGFSIAAEAYYNFGLFGTFLVGGFVGWILVACGNVFASRRISIVPIALAVGLFVHVRQSFVTCYGATISTLFFCIFILLLARFFSDESKMVAIHRRP